MGLLDGIGGGYNQMEKASSPSLGHSNRRTFKEQIQDQIAYHKAKMNDLQAVLDSMSPDVLKFVEALQKVNG